MDASTGPYRAPTDDSVPATDSLGPSRDEAVSDAVDAYVRARRDLTGPAGLPPPDVFLELKFADKATATVAEVSRISSPVVTVLSVNVGGIHLGMKTL